MYEKFRSENGEGGLLNEFKTGMKSTFRWAVHSSGAHQHAKAGSQHGLDNTCVHGSCRHHPALVGRKKRDGTGATNVIASEPAT